MSEVKKGESGKKRKTSNGLDTRKKSRQDVPSEESSEVIPREVPIETSRPGASAANAPKYLQIVVTGPRKCGRSSLVCSYMDQLFPPPEGNFLSKPYMKRRGSNQPVMIWDLDARDKFSGYRQKSYTEADVALLCFDVKKPRHFVEGPYGVLGEMLRKWSEEVKGYCNKNTKIIFVGLKKDLRKDEKFNEQDFFQDEDINSAAFCLKIQPQNRREVSAYTDKDEVKALFEYAVSLVAEPQSKQMFSNGGFEIIN